MASFTVLAVLVPTARGSPPPPQARPLGRAALLLASEGIDVVFAETARGGRVDGVRATAGGWEPVADIAVLAAYDRFPAETRADAHRALLAGLVGVPVANPPDIVALCRDKLDSQRVLCRAGLSMPAVQDDPRAFASQLDEWGVAFHKPRYGALGRAVRRVVPGDTLLAMLPSALPGIEEAALLQQAVLPPKGYAGVSARILVQREHGAFVAVHPVVRRSRTDPVANAARGSEVALFSEVWPKALPQAIALAVAATEVLARQPGGDLLLEVGVDLALDESLVPHLIEVNGRPQGRLEVLASQDPLGFGPAHVEACARPLRTLACLLR